MIWRLERPALAAPLFGDWPETILWSCLHGIMGAVYGDRPHRPHSAMAHLGDFAFFPKKPTGRWRPFVRRTEKETSPR